jgi:hypothetical protein
MEMVDSLLQLIRAFPRILTIEAFKQLVESYRGLDLSQMLVGFRPLKSARKACSDAITTSYEQVRSV